MTTLQMDEFGLRYVTQWLERNGYRIQPRPGSQKRAMLAATGPDPIIVDVRTALHPARPAQPTPAEWHALRLEAASTGRKVFAALVTLAQGGPLFRDIEWLET